MNQYIPSQNCGEFGSLEPDKFEQTFLYLIKSDIETSQLNLKYLPEKDRRGLAIETLQRFHCGWIPDWVNTKNRAQWICGTRDRAEDGKPKPLPPPSRRIIIPTPDMTHFNAVVPPSDRRPGDNKWCKIHVGAKSLFFDPKSLKGSDVVALLEGEIDGMSIWQCSYTHFPFVSILGRNMWRKVLLPQLKSLLKGKKFILLFDKDDGQIDSVNLCETLISMGIPAVSKYFFDFLADDDKEFFGHKVDANQILVERGSAFLRDITQNIFDDAIKELKNVEEKISKLNLFAYADKSVDNRPNQTTAVMPAQKQSEGINLKDKDKIPEILSHIPVNQIDRDKWIAIGMILKRYGLSFEEFNQWSSVDDKRYDPQRCKVDWDSFWTQGTNDGNGYTIATLIHIAKQFGYVPSGKSHNNPQPEQCLPPEILEWQNENGLINPDTLSKLNAAAKRIAASNNFTAAVKDTTTLKYLGAFCYYSFLSHITDKFIADVKKFKLDVKEKKKNFDAEKRFEELSVQSRGESERARIAALAPSDAELSILDLSINALSNEISKYKTAAGRAHRSYLKQCEADALAAKYNAEREKYENSPPTTKSCVPDCPVDLILPLGVYFDDDNGIRIVDFDKPPGKNGRPVIEASPTLIVPVQSFQEVTERGQEPRQGKYFKIAIKNCNKWAYAAISAGDLTDQRTVVKCLAKYGALITEPKFFVKAMAKIIALNEKNSRLKYTRMFCQPGWHGDEFIFPTGGADYVVKNGFFDYEAAYSPCGDKDAWRTMFHRVLYHNPDKYNPKPQTIFHINGTESHFTRFNNPANFSKDPNPVAAMVLGCAFAAPLVKPLKIRNPQLMLGFDSGHGKTAAAKFAVSFFSNPDYTAPSFNATPTFLEDLVVKNNDFPIVVDELQSLNKQKRENLDDFIYNYCTGETRGRADIHGNAKPTWKYRSSRIFTGEQSILNDNSGTGAIARVFNISTPRLFADPFAVEIHDFITHHYALFGRDFTEKFLPNHIEEIQSFYQKYLSEIKSMYDMLSSHCSIVAACFTGLRVALEVLGYSNAEQITLDALVASYDILKESLSKEESSNKARALPELLSFINSHPKNFAHEGKYNGAPTFIAADANETYGIELADGRIAFNTVSLKKILNTELNFPNGKQIINSFGLAGYFDSGNSKGKKYQKQLPSEFASLIGKNSWYYILKAPDVLAQIIKAEKGDSSAA